MATAGPYPEHNETAFNHFHGNEARDGNGHVGNAGHDPGEASTPQASPATAHPAAAVTAAAITNTPLPTQGLAITASPFPCSQLS